MASEAIFLNYDRETLDRQYINQLHVPRFAEHVAFWQSESARARAELPGHLDVPFGPSPDEILDIFPPAASAGQPAPVQVFFHGGYWRAFQARDFDFVARRLCEAGALVVIVNYALIPAVRMAELVRQCRAALAWVGTNMARYGGDPRRIYISGHSAGGHLVAMLQAVATPAGEPEVAGSVRGGVAISGLYDLEPIRLTYLQETLQLTAAEVQAFSPERHLPAKAPPLVIGYGAAESEEFVRHATHYGRLLRERGIAVEVRPLAGHDHMSVCAALADRNSEPTQLILNQMGLR
ncbi:MAG: alpha/beta hydrolase [Dongiaceae bacterium]